MDPKDWFSYCKICGKRYETRFKDNGLCEYCNIKQKIIDDTKWLTSSISKNNMYKLENNIILEYLSKGDVPQKRYKIFDLNGNDIYNHSFNTFNECLVVIALCLEINDLDTLKYFNIKE